MLSGLHYRGFEILRLGISDWGWPGTSLRLHQSVVPDGFIRTTLFGFLCQRLLFWRDGLVIDNCHADFLIASEEVRRGAATHVAVARLPSCKSAALPADRLSCDLPAQ